MKKWKWRLHYEKDSRVLECHSLSMEVFDAPNGVKTYFFQTPSPNSDNKVNTVTIANIFMYLDRTCIEWVNDNNELVKTLKIKNKAEITYQNGILKVWVLG